MTQRQPTLDILKDPVAYNFTSPTHHDTYDAINPTKFNLTNKSYVVTGASKGIGRAMVISLAKAGASSIALLARTPCSETVKLATAAAREARREAPRMLELSVDMTDRKAVDEAAKTVEREIGRLDVLVNNAGYLETWKPLAETDPDDWWKAWEVNIRGVFLMDRAFIPLLLKGGHKTIITVTSAGGLATSLGASAYQGSKTAQMRLNDHIMADYGEQGLVSYCIHPGGVQTELAYGMPKDMHKILQDQPELAADTLVWLTSEKRDWLAGRYVSVCWDMEDLLSKKDDIVRRDLLKLRLRV